MVIEKKKKRLTVTTLLEIESILYILKTTDYSFS